MSDKRILSRRKWLLGMARRTANHVAEAAVERIPEPLMTGEFGAIAADLGATGHDALAAGAGPAVKQNAVKQNAAEQNAAEQNAAEQNAAEQNAAAEPTYYPLALVLHTELCIAYLGIDCGACARLCPEEVEALWLIRGRPVIDPDACVDCAACVRACPTSPRALDLIDVLPEDSPATAREGATT